MKKLVSVVIVIAMLSMIFVGCGKEAVKTDEATTKAPEVTSAAAEATVAPVEAIDTSKHVKLKMYFIGSAPDDMDKVWAEINKKLTEKINAEVEPVILGWGDWADRYPLLFASGEAWDMIYTANWAFYSQQSSKGGFLELTPDMLAKYAPLTLAKLAPAALETTKVNGKNYMIPANSKWSMHEVVAIRGDLREKYGLAEVKTIADLEVYMDKVLENEDGMIPLADMSMVSDNTIRAMLLYPQGVYSLVDNVGQLVYKYTDPTTLTTTPTYELPGYLDYMKKMVDWRKKGYWSRSALTTGSTNGENFLNGLGAANFTNIDGAQSVYADWKVNHPEWKLEVVDLTAGEPLTAQGFLGNGNAINAASENPERALMALDLLGYDPEINYLVMQGIPGVHTNNLGTADEWKIESISPTYGGLYSQWGFGNVPAVPVDSYPGYTELRKKLLEDQIVYHPALGLVFNPDNVKTEIAATTQVIAQYMPIIELGFNDDPQATLDAYIKALKDAGIDKVNAEILVQAQAQFDSATK